MLTTVGYFLLSLAIIGMSYQVIKKSQNNLEIVIASTLAAGSACLAVDAGCALFQNINTHPASTLDAGSVCLSELHV